MSVTAQIIYRSYLFGARGALKAGIPIICRTADKGLRRAERALAGGSGIDAQVDATRHGSGRVRDVRVPGRDAPGA